MTPLPWEKRTYTDNRKTGGKHHTYRITPQNPTLGSLSEEDADFILLACNSYHKLATESEQLRKERDELFTWQNNARHAKAELDLERIRLQDIIRDMEAKLDKAKDALRFYGDPEIYKEQKKELLGGAHAWWHYPAVLEEGQRAITTLEEIS